MILPNTQSIILLLERLYLYFLFKLLSVCHTIIYCDLESLLQLKVTEPLMFFFIYKSTVQPFIMLCLVYIGMDQVISESCYKGAILHKNYRKMKIDHSMVIFL